MTWMVESKGSDAVADLSVVEDGLYEKSSTYSDV